MIIKKSLKKILRICPLKKNLYQCLRDTGLTEMLPVILEFSKKKVNVTFQDRFRMNPLYMILATFLVFLHCGGSYFGISRLLRKGIKVQQKICLWMVYPWLCLKNSRLKTGFPSWEILSGK